MDAGSVRNGVSRNGAEHNEQISRHPIAPEQTAADRNTGARAPEPVPPMAAAVPWQPGPTGRP